MKHDRISMIRYTNQIKLDSCRYLHTYQLTGSSSRFHTMEDVTSGKSKPDKLSDEF